VSPSAGNRAPVSYSVVIPVGPGEHELDACRDTLHSLSAHIEGREPHLVLIDDGPEPRPLAKLWSGAEVVRTGAWESGTPDPLSAMTAGMIEGLRRARGSFALKLDTDALVIAPFVEPIRSAFEADPGLGVIGACDRSPGGGIRDWSGWGRPIRRSRWPVRLVRVPDAARRRLAVCPRAVLSHTRRVVRAALANPEYVLGAHCLGGAYAVSEQLLSHALGWQWRPWAQTGLGEDVVLGLYCAAAGLRMRSLVDDGEPFGIRWRGLPGPPDELARRGFSIVHSVKSGSHGTEDELRAWFRARRAGTAPDER
jgi:hypothetical protein